jgi:hypothetical protein
MRTLQQLRDLSPQCFTARQEHPKTSWDEGYWSARRNANQISDRVAWIFSVHLRTSTATTGLQVVDESLQQLNYLALQGDAALQEHSRTHWDDRLSSSRADGNETPEKGRLGILSMFTGVCCNYTSISSTHGP